MMVTLEHLHTIPGYGKGAGFCHRGTRPVFAGLGLDWDEFRKNGLDSEALIATGHPLVIALARHAETMEAARGQ